MPRKKKRDTESTYLQGLGGWDDMTPEDQDLVRQACFRLGHDNWDMTPRTAKVMLHQVVERKKGEAVVLVTKITRWNFEQLIANMGYEDGGRAIVDAILHQATSLLSTSDVVQHYMVKGVVRPRPPADGDEHDRVPLPATMAAYEEAARVAEALDISVGSLFEDAFSRMQSRMRRAWLEAKDVGRMPAVNTALAKRSHQWSEEKKKPEDHM